MRWLGAGRGRVRVISMLLSGALLIVAPARAVTIGGSFTLTASDGSRVTDQTYRGRWLLVYFGYTACPDSCPTALADMASALRSLGADGSKLQPLFITMDPQRDTPERMGAYTASFDPRIIGLTGAPEAIAAAAQAYGAYAVPRGDAERAQRFDHSVYIYLMNPEGKFVRAFDPGWSGEGMASAIRQAMETRRNQEAALRP